MSISIKPYQDNTYWYARDNSVTSPAYPSSGTRNTRTLPGLQSENTLPSVILHLSETKTDFFPVSSERNSKSSDATRESQYSDYLGVSVPEDSQTGSAESEESLNNSSVHEIGLYNKELTEQELRLLDELQKADTEVRAHEMAHIAAGGQYVTSGAQLGYRKGPDGKRYAVSGEVSIDTSEVAGDPDATIAKMRQVQTAALAPASPSSQDRKVAASAGARASEALSELIRLQTEERTENNQDKAFGALGTENSSSENTNNNSIAGRVRRAADSYSRIGNMPAGPQTKLFSIAV